MDQRISKANNQLYATKMLPWWKFGQLIPWNLRT